MGAAGLALAGSGHQLVGHAQEQQERRITATLQFQCCAIMGRGLFWNVGSKLCTMPLLQRGIRSLAMKLMLGAGQRGGWGGRKKKGRRENTETPVSVRPRSQTPAR